MTLPMLALGLVGGCQSAPPHGSIKAPPLFGELTFADACTRATAEKKPVFIFFDGAWSEESGQLLTEIFPDREVDALLRHHTIPLHIEMVTAPDLTARYHVRDAPLLLLVGADGREIDRWTGFENARDCKRDLTAALAGETTVERLRAQIKPDDLKGRFKLGQKLIASGSYDEALAELTSLYSHPKLKEYSFTRGASKSSIIRALAGIQKSYPPASAALKAWRQQYEAHALADPRDAHSAPLVSVIDRSIEDDDHLLAFFRQLPANSRASNRIKPDIFELLTRRRAYHEASSLMDTDEAIAALHQAKQMPLVARGVVRLIVPFRASQVIKGFNLGMLLRRLVYFEAYAGAGNIPAARRIAETIIAEDESGHALEGLRVTAKKARKADANAFLNTLEIRDLQTPAGPQSPPPVR